MNLLKNAEKLTKNEGSIDIVTELVPAKQQGPDREQARAYLD
jgi:hypothetical protein